MSLDAYLNPWKSNRQEHSNLNPLHSTFKETINHLPVQDRDRTFVELNVLDQLRSLRQCTEVVEAIERRGLQLHGIVYDAQSGQASRLLEGYETKD